MVICMNTVLSTSEKFPKFLRVLFFVEMWERFSYYGMRALLVLFLTSSLGFSDERAYAIYSLFAVIGYSGPIIGGFLADKLMGFRNMVFIGAAIMIIGHISMALSSLMPNSVFIGLALIAVGTGLFKGNITNLLGSCYKPGDSERDRGFTLFYVSVNLGAFVASIACGYVAELYGWHYGFGLAGVGMTFGLLTFLKFESILGDNGLSPRLDLMNKTILWIKPKGLIFIGGLLVAGIVSKMLIDSDFFVNIVKYSGLIFFGIFAYIIFKSPAQQKRNLIALSILTIFLMCFFALEMQLGSLINLFTERNVVDTIFGIYLPASVSQAINPLSITILGFFLGRYMKFNKKYSIFRFLLGLLTMVICFIVFYIGCLYPNSEGKIAYIYLVIAMSFMGLGELFIAPFIQSQATLLAPVNLRGFIMGIIMLALAFSNLAGVIISKFMSVPSVDGVVNCFQSLEIYKVGFLKIAMFNSIIVVIFLLFCIFLQRVINEQK